MLAIFFPVGSVLADGTDTLGEDKRLLDGDVILEQSRLDQAGGSVKVKVLVRAPAAVIWRVITSCEHAMYYLEGMKGCEILFDNEAETLTRHVVDPGWLGPTIDYRFRTLKEPYHRLDIDLREGNLDRLDGYWEFEQNGDSVVLTHLLHIKPKFPTPRWLLRGKLERQLPGMMVCIRALSGGSFSEAEYEADLARCPGPSSSQEGQQN